MQIALRFAPGAIHVERVGEAVLTARSQTVPVPEGLRYASEGAISDLVEQLAIAINLVLE